MLPGMTPTASLDIDIERLRSARGMIRLCVTADPRSFPGCVDDPRAVTRSVPANTPQFRLEGLPLGNYAIAVIHDENNNSRLDTFAGIPREGFGFSRNPAIGFGPPRFDAARFAVTGPARQEVRMRYML